MAPVPMPTAWISKISCIALLCILPAVFLAGCRKPASEAEQTASPATATAQAGPNSATDDLEVGPAAVRILSAAHRSGGIILRGECGPLSITDSYRMKAPVTLEPMDKALQEMSAAFQNVYWRESPASGVRVADSNAKAGLLRVKLREFRVIEDREPDAVMAVLWRKPEVAAFLRRNHVHFARHALTARKAISPPMIIEMKNATVADILDRIASGYRQEPPKIWMYRECEDRKEIIVDLQMK